MSGIGYPAFAGFGIKQGRKSPEMLPERKIMERKTVNTNGLIMCVSNSYTQKYYLDKAFDKLPQAVKDELKIMCVLYTEEVGGIFTMMFDADGSLQLISSCDEGDLLYDDIGSELLIKKMRMHKQELFESLEKYYEAFC